MQPLVLACAVDLESGPVRARLRDAVAVRCGTRQGWRGRFADRTVILVECGMGKTNAAHALTALLEREPVDGLIGFGVGGAYPGSGLEPGEIAVASSQIYGDEGVETPSGWISCEGIGIPLAEATGEPLFNRFPLDPLAVEAAAEALGGRMTHAVGPFVTVSCCSGTNARAVELARRHDAICETMEGAAYAHVATLYGVSYREIRGISNHVEDRDTRRWRLAEAAEAAADALEMILAAESASSASFASSGRGGD